MKRATASVILSLFLAACGGAPVTKAPPPFRPTPVAKEPPPPPPKVKTDCEPSGPSDALPFLPYEQRRLAIDEAQDLAKEGASLLGSAKTQGVDQAAKEQFTTQAVDQFITALLADPYNVEATYGLAAAYALIDRIQCSINMLERLLQMRSHPSKKPTVDAKINKLLGRNNAPLDDDFDGMRADTRFRELIQRAGTPAP